MKHLLSGCIFLIFGFCNPLWSQETGPVRTNEQIEKKQKVFITVGPEINLQIPTDFGSTNSIIRNDTLFKISPQIRFRLGVSLRFDFSKKFSLQTGLYYISRQIACETGISTNIEQNFDTLFQRSTVNYIGYEIPIMGLFYVQLGERWFLNNAVGLSLEFFPSSSESQDSPAYWKFYNGRNSWLIPAARASVGFEYRTPNGGNLYLGGSFHRPLFAITDMLSGSKVVLNEPAYQYFERLKVSGTYFSVDVKYYLPTGKKNKFTK